MVTLFLFFQAAGVQNPKHISKGPHIAGFIPYAGDPERDRPPLSQCEVLIVYGRND